MLRTLEEKVDPKHTAVILVDIQNDFCHEDSPLAALGMDMRAAQAAAERTNDLIAVAREAGALCVFVQYVEAPYTRSEMQDELRERMRGVESADDFWICQVGSWGAEFYEVSPRAGEPIVVKTRYSAFIDTNLDRILRSSGIKTLIMTGVATNVCVESTARDGYQRDYYVVFLDDCTACYNPERHESTLANMGEVFGVVASAADVMAIWQRAPVAAR
jgi:ureidoacrylate peracid hydrolase